MKANVRELSVAEVNFVAGGVDMTGWTQEEIDEYNKIQSEKGALPTGGVSSVAGVEGVRSVASRLD